MNLQIGLIKMHVYILLCFMLHVIIVVEGSEKIMNKTYHKNKHGVRDAHSTTAKKDNNNVSLITLRNA